MIPRTAILCLLLLGTLAADQIRVDHREGTTGNFAPIPLTTLPNYVLTFDANGNPVIGPATGGISDGNKGDITVAGSGSSLILNPASVTLGKMADLVQGKIIGRATAGAGIPEALTLGPDFTYALGNIALAVAPQPINAVLTDLAGLTAAQGDILIGNGAGDWIKLAKGTASQVLRMNAGATLPEWAAPAAAGSVATDAIFDAKGDLAVGTGSDAAARLAVGANNFVLTADSAQATGLKWAAAAGGGIAAGDSPTWTGAHVFSKAGAAGVPTVAVTGVPFTGGDATTTKPLVLIEPTGTTSNAWSTAGTILGVNAPSGFVGYLAEFQIGTDSKCNIFNSGRIASKGGFWAGWQGSTAPNNRTVDIAAYDTKISLGSGIPIVWESTANITGAIDLALYRLGPANLRQGKIPSATPLVQTFTIGEASRPGTDNNVAGANGTLQSGLGTGTGTASSLIFQTPTVAGAGSGVQTYATRLSLDSLQALFTGSISINSDAASLNLGATNRVKMRHVSSVADGVLVLLSNTEATFGRLALGGTTSAFPAIKRNAAALNFRLADDSADANITAGALTVAAEPYGAGWDNDPTVPTKEDLFEKIQTMGGGVAEARGYTTANQATTSGTAVNVTAMSFAIAANEVWSFQFYPILTTSAAGGTTKFAIDVPTGATVGAQVKGSISAGAAVISADATLTAGVMNTATGFATIFGTVQNGANAGTVQLQFASGDGIATTTVIGNGTYFTATKMN